MKKTLHLMPSFNHRLCRTGPIILCLCLLFEFFSSVVLAQKPAADLTTKSLEDLMNIEVTSASKKEEKLFATAAAIYVITAEDIRRSGLSSLPELMRLVPGMQVARIDGNKYAISARGFNGRFANKLLVLIDGRSVYSPETSGVYWEAQDIPLDEIERIEVIRGPGGTLWGANAVNGVINIKTKTASDSQGYRLTIGAGSQELGLSSARYGSTLGMRGHFKIYGQFNQRSGLRLADERAANDGQKMTRGGFRFDWQGSQRDAFTVQGDIFESRVRENPTSISLLAPLALPINSSGELSGGHVLGRWQHTISPTSETSLQVYLDRTRRELFDVGERIDTFDIDWQHHQKLPAGHDIVWGAGYRRIADNTNSNIGTPVQFTPTAQTIQLFSGFAQDDLTLVKDRLRLTFGAKVEHNAYTAFEFQPNVRLLWTPSSNQTFWLAGSGGVRALTRVNQSLRANVAAFPSEQGLPVVVSIFGNPALKSEEMRAFEFGYRSQLHSRITVDLATFYNAYDRLVNLEPRSPFLEADQFPPRLVLPNFFGNNIRGETYGAEISANLELTRRWQVRGNYTLLRMQLHRKPNSHDLTAESIEGDNPRHQVQFHSYFNLPRNFEIDAAFYHVGALPGPLVPRYNRLDLRLGWRLRDGLAFSFGGQNLLDAQHPEFNGTTVLVNTSQIRRGVFGKLTWVR